MVLEDDRKDLLAEATEGISLDSPEGEVIFSSVLTPATPTTFLLPRIELKGAFAPGSCDRSREEVRNDVCTLN